MLDLQLIPTLPTLKDLLGPDWETRAAEEARRTLAEVAVASGWPRELRRQVDESLGAFSWRSPRRYHATVNETLGELGQWREVLQAGVQLTDVGPTRRKILNQLFEVADIPIEVENLETVIPTLAELLGANWDTCSWDEAMDVVRAWFNVNPSTYVRSVTRVLIGARRQLPDCQTLGAARQRLSMPSTRLQNVAERSWRTLYHLFTISSTLDAATGQVYPDFDMSAQAERLEYLSAHLSESDRRAWITLGRRMLPDTEDATLTELTDIHPRLRRDQITLWLDLGEQMLQRATREDA